MNALEGWIDRIGETPDLSDRLEIARTPTERATVYAEAGIWFDAIAHPESRAVSRGYSRTQSSLGSIARRSRCRIEMEKLK